MTTIKRIRNTSATVHTFPNGIEILYSYSTPVAVYFPGYFSKIWRTEEHYSVTTSRQLNEYCRENGSPVEMVEQSSISAMSNPENYARAMEIANELEEVA